MKKILSLLVLGSMCVLNTFAMKKTEEKKDGFFITKYKSIIRPKSPTDPLVQVIMLFSNPKNIRFDKDSNVIKDNKIVEVGKQLRELDSNPDKMLDVDFQARIASYLNFLLEIVGSPTKTEKRKKSVQSSMNEYDEVEYDEEIPVPGKHEFVTGIIDLKLKLEYFIACMTCGMSFEEALQQLEKNKNLTAKDVNDNFQYNIVNDLTTKF
jgi:hypothetical protein